MKFAPARKADRILIVILMLTDMITIPLVFLITWVLRTVVLVNILPDFHHDLSIYSTTLPVVALLWLLSFSAVGLYRPRRYLGNMGELQQLMKAYGYLAVALMAASYLVRMDYSRIILFMFIVISIPVTAFSRAIARKLAQIIAPVREVPRILVVGTGEVASRVISAVRKLPAKPPVIVAVITAGKDVGGEFEGVQVVDSLDNINRQIEILKVDEVFFAAPELDHSRMLEIISSVKGGNVHFRLMTDLFEITVGGTDLDDLARLPVIEIGYCKPGIIHRITKRSTDIIISFLLLVLMFPLMTIMYMILLSGKTGSPLFRQRRVGLKGKEFAFYKFRTMKPGTDEYEVAPSSMNDPRVTGFGKFLRRTSLDELPQLFNIIKGDMSLVGPRPEMPFIVKNYKNWQRHRLDVKPGLTGLWQIMGRKELPLHENLEFDFYYIRNQSLMLDFTILLRTVISIFRGRGAY